MTLSIGAGVHDLRKQLEAARQQGRTIGFVPTMGYLHAGHQSLIEASARAGHFTLVSVFINPTQFGPNEDLDAYPRDAEHDLRLANQSGADLVWFPDRQDLYPEGTETTVLPGSMAQCLCGISRPQFFGGICTVVLKFFNMVQPTAAYFGEKDFQQLSLIRKMAADFMLDVNVVGEPCIRENDGLAMSSRNAMLEPQDREAALSLYRALSSARTAFKNGMRDAQGLRARLVAAWPDTLALDYLDFRDPEKLQPVTTLKPNTRIFIGAWLRGIRLIDNTALAD